jgi:hypothetical protein
MCPFSGKGKAMQKYRERVMILCEHKHDPFSVFLYGAPSDKSNWKLPRLMKNSVILRCWLKSTPVTYLEYALSVDFSRALFFEVFISLEIVGFVNNLSNWKTPSISPSQI